MAASRTGELHHKLDFGFEKEQYRNIVLELRPSPARNGQGFFVPEAPSGKARSRQIFNKNNNQFGPEALLRGGRESRAAMQLEIARYRHFVDRFDMPEDQKVAVLTEVWKMMGSFVDRAFGQAPEQQLRLGAFGSQRNDQGISAARTLEGVPATARSAVRSPEPLTPRFNDAAEKAPARKRRR